jgi:hypothetical protein
LLLLLLLLFGVAVRNPGGQLQPSVLQVLDPVLELEPHAKFWRDELFEEPPVLEPPVLVVHKSLAPSEHCCLLRPSKLFGLFESKVPEQQKLTA